MARPLSKTDKNGTLYTRAPTVEAAIDCALGQDLETLRTRARIRQPKSPDYLPSECLVHLIRKAHREAEHHRRDILLALLFERCEANLNKHVDGSLPNAPHIRQQILNDFGTLFALDGTPEDKFYALDFFECRFNLALHGFRITHLRSILNSENELVPLPATLEVSDTDDDVEEILDHDPPATSIVAEEVEEALIEGDEAIDPEEDAEIRAQFSTLRDGRADCEDGDFRVRVFRAIMELPKEEARALLLVHWRGLKVESNNPNEVTAATLCKVSGRMIRYRLKQAIAKVSRASRLKEDA